MNQNQSEPENMANDKPIKMKIKRKIKRNLLIVPSVPLQEENMVVDVWGHIFEECKIDVSKDLQYITSTQIKNCKKTWTGKNNQFEPRLLCKMDTSCSRPNILKKNGLYMLSVKNGTYLLTKKDIYIPLQTFTCVPNRIIKKHDSLLLDIGDSESSMLDNMLYNGTLDDIIGEKVNQGPLLGGRHRCSFETSLGGDALEISGSQYETDGCYETDNYVCIVEAKSIYCKDFNIRQLYYPFREVHKKVGDKKTIIALFIYKDKGQRIHIHKFRWGNYTNMLDIENIGYFEYIQL